jgi:hypothetical protein
MAIIVCPHCGGDVDTESVLDDDAVLVASRGGSWLCIPRHSRSGCRDCGGLEDIDVHSGFRLILPPINCTRILRGNSFVTGSPFPLSAKRNGTRDTCNLVFTTFRPVLPQ